MQLLYCVFAGSAILAAHTVLLETGACMVCRSSGMSRMVVIAHMIRLLHSCTYLAQHGLESVNIIVITIVVAFHKACSNG